MNGDILTIVMAVAGIGVGFATSWWFALAGKREAQTKQAALIQQISTLRDLLSGVAKSVAQADIGVERALQSAQVSDEVPSAVATSLRSTASTSSVDVLVRASLGTLLNEYGEVSVPRLLREVARSLPGVNPSSVLSSLEELRKTGRASWAGDDVTKADVIVVHPHQQ